MALFGAALVAAQPNSAADVEWAEIQVIKAERPATPIRTATENAIWSEKQLKRLQPACVDFYRRHPGDPRRWDALLEVLYYQPRYFASYRPAYDLHGDPREAVVDVEARAVWHRQRADLIAEINAAPDAPLELREEAAIAAIRAFLETEQPDIPGLAAEIAGAAARFPESRPICNLVTSISNKLERKATGSSGPLWTALASTPHSQLRLFAEGINRVQAARTHPLDLPPFVAVDGRKVDLAALRGKVVLVDFWGTGCGPCLAELPNLKAVFEKYHAHGFEVIGIALEGPKDRERLVEFVRKNEMPWPQHFDGKDWDNEIAVRYAISAIPTAFLLNREGLLVSTNARGAELDGLVSTQLGLK